ncbi:MAG: hypothetical protein IJL70_02895, partial [Treponema sp.]|nr:hypothetical protein [Treponema sp.]
GTNACSALAHGFESHSSTESYFLNSSILKLAIQPIRLKFKFYGINKKNSAKEKNGFKKHSFVLAALAATFIVPRHKCV